MTPAERNLLRKVATELAAFFYRQGDLLDYNTGREIHNALRELDKPIIDLAPTAPTVPDADEQPKG